MKLLIKQARIVDPLSPFNGQTVNLFIENGMIARIGAPDDTPADQVIGMPGIHVSPGWVDVFAHFADPGLEYKETLESGAAAAAAGGFTDVFILPNTQPAIHNKAAVEYITHKSQQLPVTVHPLGAVTKNTEGKELAEMYDMKNSGAIAFSDGTQPVQSAGLLIKALQYVKAFGGVIIQVPDDRSIQPGGLMNEGIVSTRLGLPGKPALAEELMVARDIKLARYADSGLHLTAISTRKSVDYTERGKRSGVAVSCSVTPYHLFFNDEDLVRYDTNLKVNPPLRTRDEQLALQQAIREGKIDCIASHHQPHEFDSKVVEFEYARFGMSGLETSFAACQTAVPGLEPEQWVNLFAVNPRRIFGLPPATIAEGNKACLTLFDPGKSWTVNRESLRSKSQNNPFTGRQLTGKPLGIINGLHAVLA